MDEDKDKTGKDAILELAVERFRAAHDSDRKERIEALDDLEFAHNEDNYQWPAEIRQQREADYPPRPCLSLNKIPEKIDQVEGEFRQLRPSFKIRGVDSKADPKIAEIISGIIRHIEYNSNARSAYNTAHSSVLHCGRGAWRIDIEDDDDDPWVRNIVINRVPNVLAVYTDPGAKKQDKSDANYQFLTEELTHQEFKKEYPNVELGDWDSSEDQDPQWRTDKTVRVAEYWWREKTKKKFYRVKRVINGVETEMTVREDQLQKDSLLGEDEILETKEITVPAVKWCKMIRDKILEGPHDWPSRYIPIVIEIGKEINIKGQSKTRGMVRHAKTPQLMYNYWSSSNTEQIALAPKAPYLLTAKMIGKYQAMWDQANVKNYMYLLYDADPNAPTLFPKREPPPQMSTAQAAELARMEHDIMSAMGIYQASLGDEGQEKSGRAITARQRQGSIGSYTYTDNFQTALLYSMKIIIDLIPYVYDTERIIRIRGEDGTEKTVPINARPEAPMMQEFGELSKDLLAEPKDGITQYINDLTVGKYDIVVSIGPSYDTQRQEAVAIMMELLERVPALGPAAIDILVQNIDLPGVDELVKRAKKLVPVGIRDLEPGEEPPQSQPDPKTMLELKKLELDGIKEMREGFMSKVEAIERLMKAEAAERGQQLAEITAFVEELRQRAQMDKQSQEQGGSANG